MKIFTHKSIKYFKFVWWFKFNFLILQPQKHKNIKAQTCICIFVYSCTYVYADELMCVFMYCLLHCQAKEKIIINNQKYKLWQKQD